MEGTTLETNFRIKLGAHSVELYSGETIIGRDETCGVCLDDDQVSRRHAVITVHNDNAVLMDLDSRNGTMLNGVRITEPKALKDGDKIKVGGQTLLLKEIEMEKPSRQGFRRGTLDGVHLKKKSSSPTMISIDEGHKRQQSGSGMITAEADLLRKSLQMGRWTEAERLLKARVSRLLSSPDPTSPTDPRVKLTVEGLMRLAQHEMKAVWLDRLFKLFVVLKWWMEGETLKTAARLLRAVGQVGGKGVKDYLSYWNRHKGELTEEQREVLSRFEGEVRILL